MDRAEEVSQLTNQQSGHASKNCRTLAGTCPLIGLVHYVILIFGYRLGEVMPTMTVDQVLQSCTVDELERVYFLGPFAKRINFAAQQNRAVNLIYALESGSRLERGRPCAVIGGGLSGLTASAALHLLGHEVHLFERATTLLARQLTASHRVIHPTVNAWPFEPDLEPTTVLPFFDWCAGVCDDVLDDVLSEWEELAGKTLRDASRLNLSTKVLDFDERDDEVILSTDKNVKVKRFGAVIFAIGFDDEHALPDMKKLPAAKDQSYWRDEGAEEVRNRQGERRFVVSGTGDGGLIDALRLSYERFRKGRLPLQVVTQLAGTDTQTIVRTAERKARSNESFRKHGLWGEYLMAAKCLPEPVKGILEASRIDTPFLVTLVGEDDTATARDAAPIHKLMLAYTWQKGTIQYYQGIVHVGDGGEVYIMAGEKRPPAGDKASKTAKRPPPARGQRIDLGEQCYPPLVRHGAPNALKWLLRNHGSVLEELSRRQSVLSDYFVRPIDAQWLSSLPLPPNFARQDFQDKQFWQARQPKLASLSRIWPHLRGVAVGRAGFEILMVQDGWAPAKLFGVDSIARPITPTVAR